MRCQAPRALPTLHPAPFSCLALITGLRYWQLFVFVFDLMENGNNYYAGKAKQASSISWSRIGRVAGTAEAEAAAEAGAGVAFSLQLSA